MLHESQKSMSGRFCPKTVQHSVSAIASRLPSQESALSLIRYFTLWSLHKVVTYRCLDVCVSMCRVWLRDLRAAEQLILRSKSVAQFLLLCIQGSHGDT